MVNSNAGLAWRLFHLNWIPIAVMGGVLLLGVAFWGFSFEPVALAITTAIAAALAVTVYLYAFAKADQADPKLIFSLGAISQLFFVVIIMGPLTYVAGVANWPLQDHALLAIDRAMRMDPEVIARFVNDRDWLGGLLLRGYGLIKIMLLAIPIALTLTLRLVRLQVFVFAFSVASLRWRFRPLARDRDLLQPQHRAVAITSLDSAVPGATARHRRPALGSLRHLEMFADRHRIVSEPRGVRPFLYLWAL
jgi:hypothetical protein